MKNQLKYHNPTDGRKYRVTYGDVTVAWVEKSKRLGGFVALTVVGPSISVTAPTMKQIVADIGMTLAPILERLDGKSADQYLADLAMMKQERDQEVERVRNLEADAQHNNDTVGREPENN